MRLPERSRWLAVVACALLLAGCAGGSGADQRSSAMPALSSSLATPYQAAKLSDVYQPAAGSITPGRSVPVVLVVPGGGWQTADRTGLTPLAKALAAAGFFTVNASYRAGVDGAGFPVPLQDVLCAAGYAVARARAAGIAPGPVVLVGHSAGGHLVALAATSGTRLAGPCADPIPTIAGVVGMAGIYDTAAFETYMTDFFGVARDADPKRWESGDPIWYVESGAAPRDLRVLLIHGDADTVVPLEQTEAFAAALTTAGMSVTTDVVPGATHMNVFESRIAAAPIIAWLRAFG